MSFTSCKKILLILISLFLDIKKEFEDDPTSNSISPLDIKMEPKELLLTEQETKTEENEQKEEQVLLLGKADIKVEQQDEETDRYLRLHDDFFASGFISFIPEHWLGFPD